MGTWNELQELAVRSRGLRARADRQLRVSNVLLSRSYAALARQAERRSVPILHIISDDRDVPAADEDGVEVPVAAAQGAQDGTLA